MFHLSIVTPEKVVVNTEVKSLVVPGTEGYLGILSHHAPLITALKTGRIEYRDANDQVQLIAVTGGFLEVSNNKATILADAIEYASEIDIARARAAYERHKQRLVDMTSGKENGLDAVSIRAALDRAANRIKIFEQAK